MGKTTEKRPVAPQRFYHFLQKEKTFERTPRVKNPKKIEPIAR